MRAVRPGHATALRRIAVLALAAAAFRTPAAVADSGVPPAVIPYGSPFGCYQDVQIFRSLKDGEFDFCRLRLRYVPGRAECLRILVSTCNLKGPGTRPLGPPGGLEGFAERIVCPPGPPPPTCPSGYFG